MLDRPTFMEIVGNTAYVVSVIGDISRSSTFRVRAGGRKATSSPVLPPAAEPVSRVDVCRAAGSQIGSCQRVIRSSPLRVQETELTPWHA